MQIHVSQHEDHVLATLAGFLDDSAGELFRHQLHPLVARRGASLVLDLSQAKRINSAGLSHLVILATHANTNSSRLILAACSPFIAGVLQRSKLDQYFEVAESIAAARARLSQPDA